MKKYEALDFEIIYFAEQDIVVTSNGQDNFVDLGDFQ